MKYYIYDIEKASQGLLFVLRIVNSLDNLGINECYHESDLPFIGYPIIEGDTIRPATRVELIELGKETLPDSEVLYNGVIYQKIVDKGETGYVDIFNETLGKYVKTENHIGECGYIHETIPNEFYCINEYGEYPPTWTTEKVYKFEELKTMKLADITTAFNTIESKGYTASSLGFRIDATKVSLEDVQGLMNLIDKGLIQSPVQFRDYDNQFHYTTREQLETLEVEIQAHGVTVYAEKWNLEMAVQNATTVEQVQAIDPHSMSGYDWE